MTEKDAAIAYARAWNTLDANDFLELLDEDAKYVSQWVFEEMEGKDTISEYLLRKIETVKDAGTNVYAELGIAKSGLSVRDCVFMSQGKKGEIQAVVLFEVDKSKILKYILCIPELLGIERSGIYPD